MNKREFLEALRKAISGLPLDETEQRIEFYSEMIDDRIEDGLTEEEAVSDIGDISEIADQIMEDIPLSKIVKARIKPKKKLSGLAITLIICGFPLWLPLLISAFAVLISLYVCLWAVDICLWAVFASFAGTAFGTTAMSVMYFVRGNVPVAVASIGAALVCAGLSILSFIGCKAATKGFAVLTNKLAIGVKRLFVRKGDNDD